MLEQSVLLAQGQEIDVDQLAMCQGLANTLTSVASTDTQKIIADETKNGNGFDAEQELLKSTLKKTDWNVSKSAKLLGLSRDMMRYRIEKYRLSFPQE